MRGTLSAGQDRLDRRSEHQRDALRIEACTTGEILELNQDKLPGCYYHRTAKNDVARTEH